MDTQQLRSEIAYKMWLNRYWYKPPTVAGLNGNRDFLQISEARRDKLQAQKRKTHAQWKELGDLTHIWIPAAHSEIDCYTRYLANPTELPNTPAINL